MIIEKLMHIQQSLKAPKNQKNTFGGYNYRSCEDILEAVKPLLAKEKCTLTLSDEIEEVGGRIYAKAKATLYDSASETDGHIDTITVTAFAREEDTKKGMDASQITGAASSYARKYALNGLFAIDDNKDSDYTNGIEKASKKPVEEPQDDSIDLSFLTPSFVDTDAPYCEKCGAKISDKVRDYSKEKYGRALCMNCQPKRNAR